MKYYLALIVVKILFSIALGLNARQLKKDCNGKQELPLLKMPKPFAPHFYKLNKIIFLLCKYLLELQRNPSFHEFYSPRNAYRLLLHIAASWQKTQIEVLVLATAYNI